MKLESILTCKCKDKYTIEEHGDGYAVYYGRCGHKHGKNIGLIKEMSSYHRDIIEKALNNFGNL